MCGFVFVIFFFFFRGVTYDLERSQNNDININIANNVLILMLKLLLEILFAHNVN